MKLGTFFGAAFGVAGAFTAAAALAQTVDAGAQPVLDIPLNPQFFGGNDPSVRKATAIVNDEEVITGSDIDHRVNFIILGSGGRVRQEELPVLREQVLRSLVDEALQIQAAEAAEIKIEPAEINSHYERYARNLQRTPQQFNELLRAAGSSEKTIKHQIHAELAWNRLLRNKVTPFVDVAEQEVEAVIERLNSAKGSEEFRVYEIFLNATSENDAAVRARAQQLVGQIRNGQPFEVVARYNSEASTQGVGGDLDWVRAERFPDVLAAAVRSMPLGQVSDPISVPGGYSIIEVRDKRQVLTADPRNAVLSLKQVAIPFQPGTTREQATQKVEQLVRATQTMGGCGRAEEVAQSLGAEIVSRDDMRMRDLPPQLGEMLMRMSVGQATTPFGSVEDRVSVLVLCGRDDPKESDGPSREQVYAQLSEDRINRQSMRYLRDLRRDAVVDYR